MFSMKNISLAVLAVAGLMSASVQAASTGPYLGAKIGSYKAANLEEKVYSDWGLDYDNATSFGILGGYNFGDGLAVEVEYNASSGTDVTYDNKKVGEYDLSNIGVYGVYRFYPALYQGLSLKSKFGLTTEDVKGKPLPSEPADSISYSETRLSIGVGVGFDLNRQVSVEGEYTMIDKDVNLLSLGLKFKL